MAKRSRSSIILIALSALACGYAFFSIIATSTVNVLYWDQWDYYKPLFDGRSVWSMFTLQHGPHRQGLGGLIIGVLAHATAWNTRADAFAVGIAIAIAFAVALLVKRRLGGELTAADALLPLLFFNLAQVESLAVVANPAHGAVPLLLAMLYVFAWTIPNRIAAFASIAILNLLLIFTGFGLFFGAITPVLLLIEVIRRFRWEPLAALVFALLSLALFFYGWKFEPAIDCFVFPHPRPLEYVGFAALMFARFFGAMEATTFGIVFGTIVFTLLLAVVVVHFVRLLRSSERDARSIAIVTLGTWSLLFCANAAVGRVCSGLGEALTSRYVTLLIPGFFALYLHITTLRKTLRTVTLIVLALALLSLPVNDWKNEMDIARRYALGKRVWRDCYLREHNVSVCDQKIGFAVYPTPIIGERLGYLERNRLNLFSAKDGS
ncbi:MAG TPA: hypothetical protein VMU84_20435 [Thermoanaerobaculia bacterium]|nr:hypothetical protein [Thermoanaerobaculia bacterium]